MLTFGIKKNRSDKISAGSALVRRPYQPRVWVESSVRLVWRSWVLREPENWEVRRLGKFDNLQDLLVWFGGFAVLLTNQMIWNEASALHSIQNCESRPRCRANTVAIVLDATCFILVNDCTFTFCCLHMASITKHNKKIQKHYTDDRPAGFGSDSHRLHMPAQPRDFETVDRQFGFCTFQFTNSKSSARSFGRSQQMIAARTFEHGLPGIALRSGPIPVGSAWLKVGWINHGTGN